MQLILLFPQFLAGKIDINRDFEQNREKSSIVRRFSRPTWAHDKDNNFDEKYSRPTGFPTAHKCPVFN